MDTPWRKCTCEDYNDPSVRENKGMCICPAERQSIAAEIVQELAALDGVRALIRYMGDDPSRAGVHATPERVLKAWRQSWGAGYHQAPPALTMFPEGGIDYSQMVIVKGISFYSTCEHHLAPFFGRADIGYIPNPKRGILGISKLARVLEFFSRRLQVQERLTAQVATHLAEQVSTDVAVVLQASHMCMVSRGVQQPNATTTTSAMRGAFYDDASTRSEFFRLTQT